MKLVGCQEGVTRIFAKKAYIFEGMTKKGKILASILLHRDLNVTVKYSDVTATESVVIIWDMTTNFVS